MDVDFIDSFNQLAKLLQAPEDHVNVDPSTISRASPSPAGIGPRGIFPGVKVADPVSKTLHSIGDCQHPCKNLISTISVYQIPTINYLMEGCIL